MGRDVSAGAIDAGTVPVSACRLHVMSMHRCLRVSVGAAEAGRVVDLQVPVPVPYCRLTIVTCCHIVHNN